MNIEAFCRTLTVIRHLAGQYAMRDEHWGRRVDRIMLCYQVAQLRALVDKLERMLNG